jgi:ubiquinone/menaquinone biosynthesis C-methylase UbiE
LNRPQQLRPEQLRREYEDSSRAAHYRDDRWTRSARARRTNAKELAIVDGFVQQCDEVETLLDVPCGTGRFRDMLQQHASTLLSIDASFEMLAAAPSSPQLQASAHQLPLVDDAVDFILCSRLLHHFETSAERATVLAELARVSKRWIVLSYFDNANFQAWRNKVRGKFRGRFPISHAQFASEINTAGLKERGRHYIQRGWSEQVWVLLEVNS